MTRLSVDAKSCCNRTSRQNLKEGAHDSETRPPLGRARRVSIQTLPMGDALREAEKECSSGECFGQRQSMCNYRKREKKKKESTKGEKHSVSQRNDLRERRRLVGVRHFSCLKGKLYQLLAGIRCQRGQ